MNSQVRWILSRQALTTIGVAAMAGVIGGLDAAVSALFGGGIGTAGAFAYAWRAIRDDEQDAKRAYRAQMLGETYKYAVVLGGFAWVIAGYEDLKALPLFVGYVLTVVVYWMALLKTRN
jgi:ATP synthase protein I